MGGDWEGFKASLERGVPLEYISHTAYFYKAEFFVDERVLIPRSETELLVERAVNWINKHPSHDLKVCEVGVGSGAISLSCLMDIKNKRIDLTATDISEEALLVFDYNAFLLNFRYSKKHTLQSFKADRLKGISDKFDLILSNPPYIMEEKDRALVHQQVLEFEPHLALFLKDDSYFEWFTEFFKMVDGSLNSGGTFLMEGHESHLSDLKDMVDKQGWGHSTVLKDLTGAIRFLEVNKKQK